MTTGRPAGITVAPRRRRGWLHRAAGGPAALPAPIRVPLTVVAVFAALLCAGLAVTYAGDTAAGRLDSGIGSTVDAVAPGSGWVIHAIDSVGQPAGALLSVGVLAAACRGLRRGRLALVAVIALGTVAGVALLVKHAVGRTIHGAFLAYPSGHTATATVLALIVMLLVVDVRKLGRLAGVLAIVTGTGIAAVIMACDQIASGAHYPTDTVGGCCVGVVAVTAAAHAVDRVADRAAARSSEGQ